VAIVAASTVNFALRTPAELQTLTAAFGRWLNSLQGPAQILIPPYRPDRHGRLPGGRRRDAPGPTAPRSTVIMLSRSPGLGP
jgi:hypothetical protein